MRDVAYVNNTGVIAQNPKMTAINSCIEIDLTGQVVSDSIGTRMYSGNFSDSDKVCYTFFCYNNNVIFLFGLYFFAMFSLLIFGVFQ
jgi:hypothetical protein